MPPSKPKPKIAQYHAEDKVYGKPVVILNVYRSLVYMNNSTH